MVFLKCFVCRGCLRGRRGRRRKGSRASPRHRAGRWPGSTSCSCPAPNSRLPEAQPAAAGASCWARPPRRPAGRAYERQWWSPRGWSGPRAPSGSSRVSRASRASQRDAAGGRRAGRLVWKTTPWNTAPSRCAGHRAAEEGRALLLILMNFSSELSLGHRWFRSLRKLAFLSVWSCSFSVQKTGFRIISPGLPFLERQ